MQNKEPAKPRRQHGLFIGALLVLFASVSALHAGALEPDFEQPSHESRPETWFHLIGGNVNKAFLTTDIEAVHAAGFQGFHLFHGKGGAWPGVSPQIQTLSPQWDNLIEHVANECVRMGLKFTMQNCPGWAMSGGPWIKPEDAMRHLIWSRTDMEGPTGQSVKLAKPMPSDQDWCNYQDVAVLAFPTPAGDAAEPLRPVELKSNLEKAPWKSLFSVGEKVSIEIPVTAEDRTWLEVRFDQQTLLRAIKLLALSGWVIKDTLTSERFLTDWRDTINDLLVENYFGRMAELGRKHGLTLSFETAGSYQFSSTIE